MDLSKQVHAFQPLSNGILFALLAMTLHGCGEGADTSVTAGENNNTTTDSSVLSDSSTNAPVADTIDQSSLSAPSGLSAQAESQAIELSWDAVPEAASYRLYWSDQPGVNERSGYIDTTERQYRHEHLLEGATYYYRVSAWVYGEETPLSGEFRIATVKQGSTSPTTSDAGA